MTTKTKPKVSPVQQRNVSLATASAVEESRSLRAALSSEEPVKRYFGTEVLRHSSDAIDLSRAAENGLPLLINHDDQSLPIGRVQNIALERDGVLRGDLTFSESTDQARDAWNLAREGTLSDVSIRYRINTYDTSGGDEDRTYTATNWTLLEGSVVSVPADASVGIGRQLEFEGIDMPAETPAPTVPVTPTPSASRSAGIQEGAELERARINEINAIASQFADNAAIQDLARQYCDGANTVEQFRAACLSAMAPAATPIQAPVPHQQRVSGGPTHGEKMTRALSEAIELRCGVLSADDQVRVSAENEYTSYSVLDLGRAFFESAGISTRGMGRDELAGQLLTRYIEPGTANLTTASFTDLLANVMNKSLFLGFNEAPVTWNLWCGTGQAADFKQGSRPGVSAFTSLAEVNENASIADGIVTDKTENFQIKTFARKFSVTRQAIVNDDLGGLADVARKMGQSAGRTVDENVYTYLASNPAMNEVANLFAAGNNNLNPVTAVAPDPAAISAARVAMGRQTDWNGVTLGIVPQFVITPLELEEDMLTISTQNTDPERVRRDNVYKTLWSPVATAHLTDANDWYVAGAPGQTIDVMFLNGQQSPMLARDEGWSVLAAHWRVVLDFDVMAVDYRGMVAFTNA